MLNLEIVIRGNKVKIDRIKPALQINDKLSNSSVIMFVDFGPFKVVSYGIIVENVPKNGPELTNKFKKELEVFLQRKQTVSDREVVDLIKDFLIKNCK